MVFWCRMSVNIAVPDLGFQNPEAGLCFYGVEGSITWHQPMIWRNINWNFTPEKHWYWEMEKRSRIGNRETIKPCFLKALMGVEMWKGDKIPRSKWIYILSRQRKPYPDTKGFPRCIMPPKEQQRNLRCTGPSGQADRPVLITKSR